MIKGKLRSLAAGTVAAVALTGGLLALNGAALASGGGGSTPPWESSISPAPNGFITFYNAAGQVVTGGSITANGLGAYAVASTTDTRSGDTKATLFLYTPVAGENPLLWSGQQMSISSNYPNASAPQLIAGTSNPVESNNGTDQSVLSYITAFPNTQTAAGYVGLYDVRLKVSGPGIGIEGTFWDTVISVNMNKGTWSVDYPDWTQNTTTTLSANPPSPQTPPATPVTLTATVAPATAGTVSFWSGSTQIGTTQTVTAENGMAQVMVTPPNGTTPYQAVFTPDIASSATGPFDIGSASATLNYQVGVSPPVLGTPTLSGAGKVGTKETCKATVTGATTTTFAWKSNGKTISGATKSTYTIPASQFGKTLTCSVTASNSGGSVTKTSKGIKVGLGAALKNVTKPVVSGPHKPGGTEKVTAGKWSPAASNVTYQWFVGKTKVKGATKSSFKVPSSDKGKTVHVVVTATATGYAAGVYTSPSIKIT